MEKKVLVTMKDIQKYNVLTDVIEKKIKGNVAAKILDVSYVHVFRLKKKIITYGFKGILRKLPPSPPNKKISQTIINNILKLRKSLYYDFNITHFKEKLQKNHNITLSYESLRQILISNGLHHPKAKKKVHRMRRRMPKANMLVQMDSSLCQII
jgi:transposase